MAYVFGYPITDSTLKGMTRYADNEITRVDRAREALNMINEEDKNVNARRYVENVKANSGIEDCTLCLIYNATGNSVTYVTAHNWGGRVGSAPYPVIIQNGQWGGYLHELAKSYTSQFGVLGSAAAVVYRGQNDGGKNCDWMLSWSIPWENDFLDNAVYTEIHEARNYDTVNWGNIYDLLSKSRVNHSDEREGCLSTVSTGRGTSPIFEGILTLSQAL